MSLVHSAKWVFWVKDLCFMTFISKLWVANFVWAEMCAIKKQGCHYISAMTFQWCLFHFFSFPFLSFFLHKLSMYHTGHWTLNNVHLCVNVKLTLYVDVNVSKLVIKKKWAVLLDGFFVFDNIFHFTVKNMNHTIHRVHIYEYRVFHETT